jgi:flagellar basal-body rod protein FlgB
MALTDSGLLRIMKSKMAYESQREAVLAQNVANANTPGYKAKDLVPFTFESAMKTAGSGMMTTNPRHIIPASMAGINAATKIARSLETQPSGNSVDLEQQMMEVSKTAVDYQAVTAIYHKFIGLFKTAIGK